MFLAFNDEMEKIASQRGVDFVPLSLEDFLEMEKEAGFLSDMSAAAGKKGRAALLGLGLMAAPNPVSGRLIGRVAKEVPVQMVQDAAAEIPFTAQRAAKLKKLRDVRVQRQMQEGQRLGLKNYPGAAAGGGGVATDMPYGLGAYDSGGVLPATPLESGVPGLGWSG